MINALLGTKRFMTSTYDARGRRVGATVIEMTPNFITQVKTTTGNDGYNAIQLGYGTKKSVKNPQIGHTKKVGLDQKVRWLGEVRIKHKELKMKNSDQSLTIDLDNIEPGQEIKLNQVFSVGDIVKVTGTTKGKGFAGTVKRHGFAGGPKTHGQSDRHRAPGSIGSGTTPGRVYKGKRMAGHMGNETSSVLNLEIVGIDRTKNFLIVKGGVPGTVGSLLTVTKLGKVKGYTPPPEEKKDEEELEEGSKNQESSNENEIKNEEPIQNKEDKENAGE